MKHEPVVKASATVAPWLVLLLLAPFYFLLPISHDAAWQMWIGRQVFHGADLYSEIVEVNPPLWFWIATPLAGLAEALDVRSLGALVAFFLSAVALSLYLVLKLERRPLFIAAFLVVCLLPLEFGQREHFTLIATIPYVLLIARRHEGEPIAPTLAFLIGAFAAVGFALKPHFVIVPVALELWLRTRPIRPETVALGAGAAAYVAALLAFERDYLTDALPLIVTAYDSFGRPTLKNLLPPIAAFGYAFGFLLKARGQPAALLVASLAFLLAFLSQGKGFHYQLIPALGLLLLAIAATEPRTPIQKAGAFTVALLVVVESVMPYPNISQFGTKGIPRGASFAALISSPRLAWPAVEERGLVWPLRSMSIWMEKDDPAYARAMIAHDLGCNPAEYLLVNEQRFGGTFPDVLFHYTLVRRDSALSWYRLRKPLPRPAECRRIH